MLKSAFPLATPSGFVAFDGGGVRSLDACPVAEGRRPVVGPAPADIAQPAPVVGDEAASVEQGMYRSPTWETTIGRRARWVEGSVIIAMCAYFVFGFFNVVRG
jgi:hypothetical protein